MKTNISAAASAHPSADAERPAAARAADRLAWAFARHWLLAVSTLFGLYVGLPWLAPILMRAGAVAPARAIYLIYSTQCHQLPERSYFLFGPQAMYPLSEIQSAWRDTSNPLILRQFIGNQAMGWKVAWSDRMVSLYTSIFAGALLFPVVQRRLPKLPLWGFALLLLPLAVDGGSHFVSDLAGIGQGFRDSNAWLSALTGGALPTTFYAGDAFGSFNWWMRLITGVLAGLAAVWLALPLVDSMAADARRELEASARARPAGR